jgi:hypothetical protein
MNGQALCLFLVPSHQVVNQTAHTTSRRADAGSFFTARQCADGCARAGASAGNQRVLLP